MVYGRTRSSAGDTSCFDDSISGRFHKTNSFAIKERMLGTETQEDFLSTCGRFDGVEDDG